VFGEGGQPRPSPKEAGAQVLQNLLRHFTKIITQSTTNADARSVCDPADLFLLVAPR